MFNHGLYGNFIFLIIVCILILFEKQRETHTEKRSSTYWLIPQAPATTRGNSQSQEAGAQSGFFVLVLDPNLVHHHVLPPTVHISRAGLEAGEPGRTGLSGTDAGVSHGD